MSAVSRSGNGCLLSVGKGTDVLLVCQGTDVRC
jgi:hypothetical protein